MSKVFFLTPCLFLSASVLCQGAQILTNPNFENAPNHALGWTVNNNVSIIDYAGPGNFMVPGSPPDANGPWGVQALSNGGLGNGNVIQDLPLAPGTYNVSASALVRIFDDGTDDPNGDTPSQVRLDIRLNGNNNFHSITFANDGSLGGWTPWTTMQTNVIEVTVAVPSTLGVRVQLRADAQSGGWAQAVADSIQLNVEQVIPEPASLVLGCVGAIACIAMHPRRRQR